MRKNAWRESFMEGEALRNGIVRRGAVGPGGSRPRRGFELGQTPSRQKIRTMPYGKPRSVSPSVGIASPMSRSVVSLKSAEALRT